MTVQGEDGPALHLTNMTMGDLYLCLGDPPAAAPSLATPPVVPAGLVLRVFVASPSAAPGPSGSPQLLGSWQTVPAGAPVPVALARRLAPACLLGALGAQAMRFHHMPVGLVQVLSPTPLPIRAWLPPSVAPAAVCGPSARLAGSSDHAAYAAFVAPLLPLRLRALFFQHGAADAATAPPQPYACLAQAAINAWRDAMTLGDYPVLLTQLAANTSQPASEAAGAALIRAQQTQLLPSITLQTTGLISMDTALLANGTLNTTAMALRASWETLHTCIGTLCLGDYPNATQPCNAVAIAARPGNGTVTNTAGGSGGGSRFMSAPPEASTLVVAFAHAQRAGLSWGAAPGCSPDAAGCPFELLLHGSSQWTPAQGVAATQSNTVTLHVPSGTVPVAVRYGWRASSCVLLGEGGLPAYPFVLNVTEAARRVSTKEEVRAASPITPHTLDPAAFKLDNGLARTPPLGWET